MIGWNLVLLDPQRVVRDRGLETARRRAGLCVAGGGDLLRSRQAALGRVSRECGAAAAISGSPPGAAPPKTDFGFDPGRSAWASRRSEIIGKISHEDEEQRKMNEPDGTRRASRNPRSSGSTSPTTTARKSRCRLTTMITNQSSHMPTADEHADRGKHECRRRVAAASSTT